MNKPTLKLPDDPRPVPEGTSAILAISNLSLTLKASSDGITFNDVTLNGEAYELDDEFLSSSHIKVELNDITDNLNPVLLDSELLNKTEQAKTRVEGMITRLKALETRA